MYKVNYGKVRRNTIHVYVDHITMADVRDYAVATMMPINGSNDLTKGVN